MVVFLFFGGKSDGGGGGQVEGTELGLSFGDRKKAKVTAGAKICLKNP